MSLLSGSPYAATATAQNHIETAVLDHPSFNELIRLRPDIAVVMYRNFADDGAQKLRWLMKNEG